MEIENESEIRERLIKEMENDAKIISDIIENFNPLKPFEIVEMDGLKIGIVRDISLVEGNPKATKVLANKICCKTGYEPHEIKEVNGEKVLMLIKDLGGKLGKSIAIGKDTLHIGVLVFDDR